MQFITWIINRIHIIIKQLYLKALFHLNRGKLNIDYGCIILPFNNDGDLQEVYYHLHGRELCPTEGLPFSVYIKNGDRVIDVGANIGIFAAMLSRLAGPEGKVFCFEPSKRTFEKLKTVKALNRLDNLELFNLGCGASSGEEVMYMASRSSGDSTLVPENRDKSGLRSEKIKLVTLDGFFAGRQERIDFIKIDTEGFDFEVLKGASGIIDAFKPAIYIELSRDFLSSSRKSMEFLKTHGYGFTVEPDPATAPSGKNFLAVCRTKKK